MLQFDVHAWAQRFVAQLRADAPAAPAATAPGDTARIARSLRAIAPLALVLDYDGTLVPIAQTPDLALPDPDLLDLLAALASRRDTAVHLVSGRSQELLDEWFGHLPLALWAEHGCYHRPVHNG